MIQIFSVSPVLGIFVLYISLLQQADFQKLLSSFFTYLICVIHNCDARLQQALGIIVQVKASVVNRLLPAGKFSIHRDSSRQVSVVATVGSTEVHQNQLTIKALLIVCYIV